MTEWLGSWARGVVAIWHFLQDWYYLGGADESPPQSDWWD